MDLGIKPALHLRPDFIFRQAFLPQVIPLLINILNNIVDRGLEVLLLILQKNIEKQLRIPPDDDKRADQQHRIQLQQHHNQIVHCG